MAYLMLIANRTLSISYSLTDKLSKGVDLPFRNCRVTKQNFGKSYKSQFGVV